MMTLTRLCNCPNSEPGKIKLDISEHLLSCKIRKKILRFTDNTFAVPSEISGGYSLGVATKVD